MPCHLECLVRLNASSTPRGDSSAIARRPLTTISVFKLFLLVLLFLLTLPTYSFQLVETDETADDDGEGAAPLGKLSEEQIQKGQVLGAVSSK